MQINEIRLEKSLTIGTEVGGKLRFRKVNIALTASLDNTDIFGRSYEELSNMIEQKIEHEKLLLKGEKE